ncbi:Golgi integral membrane protein 4a [Pleuronectes platessa]|uniref:Golgi integral membrane protein 4a n=1 Tax=Pleuronectes platessa TaxID=8262 RepID=UPI00232A2FD4|nr:Golgi integral membrane protein 4a [Pleuronectes platessa]
MGNGVCSRRQRRIFQCLLVLTVVCGMMYGGMMSYEVHKQLRRTEATALKYQQHQESLSAQLQVVYEHRSRLEKSLQKERLDHKKAKEDYLVYKLDAQQSLNKEKQDSGSRLNSLQVQHQMLKSQHEDLKKLYYDLQEQHQTQGEDHGRLLDEHKDRYEKLQQIKDGEVSQLKDNNFNLREENKQLRKAHHEIHVQLQDVQVQHQDLKAVHNQLSLTLEDHKSALAAAQVQVDELKQLKETLHRAPVPRQPEQNPVPQELQADAPKSHIYQEQQAVIQEKEPAPENHQLGQQVVAVHSQSETKLSPTVPQITLSEREEDDGEGEAERKRELAEEEMAQAGQPQKLEEDPDHPQDEQQQEEEEGEDPEQEQPDENALDQLRHQPQPDPHAEVHQEDQLQHEAHAQVEHVKSAYEQQQEQQRLEAQRAAESRQIHVRQEALRVQRKKVMMEREQRLKEEQDREHQQHKEADRREQLLREEHQRKKTEYENMNNDIVEGEEDGHTDDEDEGDPHKLNEGEEKEGEDQRVPSQQGDVDGELDPNEDPNNQGEDEFEEAGDDQPQHRVTEEEEEVVDEEEEPAAPAQHIDAHPVPRQPAVEEELVMAGNPDQQEDTLDDQYQEEVEDEVGNTNSQVCILHIDRSNR